MIQQALILAGGLGTRLGSVTKDVPKPMVAVGSKPFLEWLMLHISRQGIRHFVLCTGYLSETIQNHFGDGRAFGWKIEYSVEEELLGTGGAIQKAFPLLHEHFLVLSGDNYLEMDYHGFFQRFSNRKCTGMLSCWPNDPPLFKRNVKLDLDSSRILDYNFHTDEDKNYVDVGVKLFSQRLMDYFPARKKFSLEIDVMPHIAKDKGLYGYPVEKPPLDIGTPEGLEAVRKTLAENSQNTERSL